MQGSRIIAPRIPKTAPAAHTVCLPVRIGAVAMRRKSAQTEKSGNIDEVVMNPSELYSRLEIEFELEIPEAAEEGLRSVRDVRDYIRHVYREQGIEVSSGAVFERVRRLIAVLARVDASAIRPETLLSDVEESRPSRAWV
jgi:hypothetical protein